jgi:hypothetical protein
MEVIGLDLLTNPSITNPTTGSGVVNLDTFELPEEPKFATAPETAGPQQTWSGVENMNTDSYTSRTRMVDEHSQRRKYETLRKFDRLAKMGVPLRKRFTMDSSIEEMEMELEFIRKEKDMDRTVQQFSEWFVTSMGGMEWASKNVALVKAFGLQLDGLSEAAQMKVGEMEEDFEELYELYGDKLKMHPLVRIPIRTCMMVYMVHLTNQMVQKSPIPNIDQILKTNPEIARQLATAAMQNQGNSRAPQPAPMAPQTNPLSGLSDFMNSMVPPQTQRPQTVKSAVKIQRPPQEMKAPTIPNDISALLTSVGVEKKVVTTPKKAGSTGKNSVSIRL